MPITQSQIERIWGDNMKKRYLGLILVFILAMAMNISVYAKDDDSPDIPTSGTHEYYSYFYNGNSNIQITDKTGTDVTDFFVSETKTLFLNNDLDGIKEFMADNELVAHLYQEKINSFQLYALEQSKNVYDNITAYYKDNKYGTVMEFACKLSGTIWYNPNTYAVTRTSTPTFTVTYMGVPTGISPSCNSISTGSYVTNGKGYFWANFTVTGEGISLIVYNYGTHKVSFYGTP